MIAQIPEIKYETFNQIIKDNSTLFAEFYDKDVMTYDTFVMLTYDAQLDEFNSTFKEMRKNISRELYNEYRNSKIGLSSFSLFWMSMLKMEKGLSKMAVEKCTKLESNLNIVLPAIPDSY